MGAQGTETLNFGAFPGSNEATVPVTGQGAILTTSSAEAFLMAELTSDHTAADHAYCAMLASLTCNVPTAGAGFTIKAVSQEKLQGTFFVRWVWN